MVKISVGPTEREEERKDRNYQNHDCAGRTTINTQSRKKDHKRKSQHLYAHKLDNLDENGLVLEGRKLPGFTQIETVSIVSV